MTEEGAHGIQYLTAELLRPETKQEKKQRLLALTEKKATGKADVPTKRPTVLWTGINTAATLVDN